MFLDRERKMLNGPAERRSERDPRLPRCSLSEYVDSIVKVLLSGTPVLSLPPPFPSVLTPSTMVVGTPVLSEFITCGLAIRLATGRLRGRSLVWEVVLVILGAKNPSDDGGRTGGSEFAWDFSRSLSLREKPRTLVHPELLEVVFWIGGRSSCDGCGEGVGEGESVALFRKYGEELDSVVRLLLRCCCCCWSPFVRSMA